MFLASFSLRMGQFSDPVATHPRTNEAEVPPGLQVDLCMIEHGNESLVFIGSYLDRKSCDPSKF